MREENEKLLEKAITRNLMVWDEESDTGEVTQRLLLLMAHHAGFTIDRWVVSYAAYIHRWPYEVAPSLREKFLAMKGRFPVMTTEVIMAVGKNNEVILGAF